MLRTKQKEEGLPMGRDRSKNEEPLSLEGVVEDAFSGFCLCLCPTLGPGGRKTLSYRIITVKLAQISGGERHREIQLSHG